MHLVSATNQGQQCNLLSPVISSAKADAVAALKWCELRILGKCWGNGEVLIGVCCARLKSRCVRT